MLAQMRPRTCASLGRFGRKGRIQGGPVPDATAAVLRSAAGAESSRPRLDSHKSTGARDEINLYEVPATNLSLLGQLAEPIGLKKHRSGGAMDAAKPQNDGWVFDPFSTTGPRGAHEPTGGSHDHCDRPRETTSSRNSMDTGGGCRPFWVRPAVYSDGLTTDKAQIESPPLHMCNDGQNDGRAVCLSGSRGLQGAYSFGTATRRASSREIKKLNECSYSLPQDQADELRQKFRLLFRLVSSYVRPYTTRESAKAYQRWNESPKAGKRAEYERVARAVEAHVPTTLSELEVYLRQLHLPIYVNASIRASQERHTMTLTAALTFFEEQAQYLYVKQLKALFLDRTPRPQYPIADVTTGAPLEVRHRMLQMKSVDLLHKIRLHSCEVGGNPLAPDHPHETISLS